MAKAKTTKKVAVKNGGGSRRKAKPDTKEETVEVNNMSLLLGNMPPIKDIMYHLDQIAGYQDKARTASAKVTDAKKKAKEAGVDLKSISDGIGLERVDALDLATYFRQLQVIMRERGLPIQLSLYETKFGSIEEQGASEGWSDGRAGRHFNNDRWIEGAPGFREYSRRWNDGQRELLEKGALKNDDDE